MVKRLPRLAERNPRVNDLLRHLPAVELDAILDRALVITLNQGEIMLSHDAPAEIVYFPLTAIISTIADMRNGDEVEYGSVGREGMLGLEAALDAQPLRGRAICQVDGEVVCFKSALLRERAGEQPVSRELQRLLLRYAQSTINVLAQSAACNALHSVRQRTARVLLTTRERAGSDSFSLTQEFLAKMLGVRRPGVTDIARDLQREGIIEYRHGYITVLDAERLGEVSCECYEHVRNEYARVFDGSEPSLQE